MKYQSTYGLPETRPVCWMFSILVVGTLLIVTSNAAFLPQRNVHYSSVDHICSIPSSSSSSKQDIAPLFVSSTTNSIAKSSPDNAARPLCFYNGPGNQWRPRIELKDLRIGQELQVTEIVQELLNGRTGPKLFCEVGVGRFSNNRTNKQQQQGKWNMVFAMLRLPRDKPSVTTKRAARLRKKCKKATTTTGSRSNSSSCCCSFPVYVSRIRVENGQLEVCLTREEALDNMASGADQGQLSSSSSSSTSSLNNMIPMASLKVGQELTGRVVRVEPYGVLIDIDNVNRPGLLHIQKVADLYGSYIDKEKGLQKQAGLERGTRLQVQVAAQVKRKRLSLDFTQKTKEMAEKERQKQQQSNISNPQKTETKESSSTMNKSESESATKTSKTADDTMSEDELAAWAAYAEQSSQNDSVELQDDDDDDDDDDDYDEDRDIEDALGLGSY